MPTAGRTTPSISEPLKPAGPVSAIGPIRRLRDRLAPYPESRPNRGFGTRQGSTELSSGLPRPIQAPALPVPAQDGLRLHNLEVPSPTLRPEMAQPDPQDSIRSLEAGMRVRTQRHLELMAENQVVEREIPPRANGSTKRMNSERK